MINSSKRKNSNSLLDRALEGSQPDFDIVCRGSLSIHFPSAALALVPLLASRVQETTGLLHRDQKTREAKPLGFPFAGWLSGQVSFLLEIARDSRKF